MLRAERAKIPKTAVNPKAKPTSLRWPGVKSGAVSAGIKNRSGDRRQGTESGHLGKHAEREATAERCVRPCWSCRSPGNEKRVGNVGGVPSPRGKSVARIRGTRGEGTPPTAQGFIPILRPDDRVRITCPLAFPPQAFFRRWIWPLSPRPHPWLQLGLWFQGCLDEWCLRILHAGP